MKASRSTLLNSIGNKAGHGSPRSFTYTLSGCSESGLSQRSPRERHPRERGKKYPVTGSPKGRGERGESRPVGDRAAPHPHTAPNASPRLRNVTFPGFHVIVLPRDVTTDPRPHPPPPQSGSSAQKSAAPSRGIPLNRGGRVSPLGSLSFRYPFDRGKMNARRAAFPFSGMGRSRLRVQSVCACAAPARVLCSNGRGKKVCRWWSFNLSA